jgi:NAD(P)-dependent dehydrogenase (short-subunit alcohol dehydrogenase family)
MSFLAAFIDRQFIHYPPIQTASFQGKTIIVAGGSGGLGLAACKSLVNLGAERIIIACRNQEKGKTAANEIQETTSCSSNLVEVWSLDLSSYASVQAFAGRAKELPRLDAVSISSPQKSLNRYINAPSL